MARILASQFQDNLYGFVDVTATVKIFNENGQTPTSDTNSAVRLESRGRSEYFGEYSAGSLTDRNIARLSHNGGILQIRWHIHSDLGNRYILSNEFVRGQASIQHSWRYPPQSRPGHLQQLAQTQRPQVPGHGVGENMVIQLSASNELRTLGGNLGEIRSYLTIQVDRTSESSRGFSYESISGETATTRTVTGGVLCTCKVRFASR